MIEHFTNSLIVEAEKIIRDVLSRGGMAKAIEQGMPQRLIEEAAARKQAAIDKGDITIVGVNKYKLENEDPIDVLDIDNTEVRRSQIERLERTKASRDSAAVERAMAELENMARSGTGNLLAGAVEAARARATVGEISDALENVYGRHRASGETIKGVYESVYQGNEDYEAVKHAVVEFAEEEGRRPRMLVVKMGQDGHDRGAKVVATAFADLGFDVDVGALFSTPDEAAKQAIENDVHVIGVSSLAAGHNTLIPQLVSELENSGAGDIMVVAGGVIPEKDYAFLKESGVSAIFGPGTNIPEAALEVLNEIRRKQAVS